MIEFDLDRTNLHPIREGEYQIPISFGEIRIAVKDAYQYTATLKTSDGDDIISKTCLARNGVLRFGLHKPDSITGNLLSRIALMGELQLEIIKVLNRKEETYTFTFNELGSWNYHDHRSASKKGTVIVQ